MASFRYGIHALHEGTLPHVLGRDVDNNADDSLFEVWNGKTNTSCRFRVDEGGDVIPGPRTAADLATTATDGFLHVRSMNGAPTGTPSLAANGTIPMVYDRSAHAIYFYSGSWRSVAVT